MHKFDLSSSASDMGEGGESKKLSFNKRCCYLLAFLFIAVPVVTGVLVWYFLPKCTDGTNPISNSASGGDKGTSTTGTVRPPTGTAGSTSLGPTPGEPWKQLRLPRFITPLHYDLSLYPDFYEDHGWFYGNETIELDISQDTKYILIHFNLMNITRTMLYKHDTMETIPIKRTFSYPENQFWVVETESPIPANSMVDLQLGFDGSLTTSLVGFYKSSYLDSKTNQTRYLATSKFEPVDARKAFPCFDEPNIKANYTVTLIHRPGYTALSNMPAENTTDEGEAGLLSTRFQRSVPMSTYLVCFIVCDFLQLNLTTNEGTLLRVWAVPDKIDQAQYALELANNTMSLYAKKFDLPYPLPKQDMIAIPDFVSGAMEHWGLITYRETNMLLDENEASSANKQRVAAVITHELAHQWFGNIVTMDWWNDLWLNEGFASFMEYIGVADYETTWQMMSQFVVDDIQPVMRSDAVVNSHPIVVTVNNPDEINQVFDSISYSKGAAIIGMLKTFMGDGPFFEGIQIYLKRYQWGNARTDDLWHALSNVTGAPDVKQIMDTWTLQMGLPYVNITLEETTNGTTIRASQRRFLEDPNADPSQSTFVSPFDYTWYIPLDYATSNQSEPVTQWMNRTDVTFVVPELLLSSEDWIKFNSGQTGFYRVNYPEVLWRRFASDILPISHAVIPDVDRSGLLSDAFNLASADLLGYGVALNMTRYLHSEDDHLPWESASLGFQYITTMLQSSGEFGLWKNYILSKCRPVLDRLGWDDTGSHLKKLLRGTIISLTCAMGDENCRRNATSRFNMWRSSSDSIPPNLRVAVYEYGIQASSNTADWDFLWNRYMTENVPQERTKLLWGLTHTQETWLIYRMLDYSMDDSKVRSQDFFSVLSYLSKNTIAQPILWQWYQENWENLVDRFSLRSRSLGRSINYVTRNFNTEFQLENVQAFFKKYPDAGAGSRVRLQVIDSIRSNIQWMKKNKAVIVEWLKSSVSL